MRNLIRHSKVYQKSKKTNLLTKPSFIQSRALSMSLILAMFTLAPLTAFAQDDEKPTWWFNIELIAFKRNMLPTNNEDFEQADFDLDYADSNQLLYLSAIRQSSIPLALLDSLANCNASDLVNNRFSVNIAYDSFISFNENIDAESMLANSSNTFHDDKALVPQNLEHAFVPSKLLFDELLKPLILPEPSEIVVEVINQEQFSIDNTSASSLPINNDGLVEVVSLNTANESSIENIPLEKPVDINELQERLEQMEQQLTDIIAVSTKADCLQGNSASGTLEATSSSNRSISILDDKLASERINEIPSYLFNPREIFTGDSQLIAESELYLSDYANKVFKQSDIQALLYTAWRQEVEFGAENAQFFQVRAGKRLESKHAQQYEQWNKMYEQMHFLKHSADQATFFMDLKLALEENQDIDWLALENVVENPDKTMKNNESEFELDGLFKVYLDYVNQVPYLHIDTEFKHYRLNIDEKGEAALASYPFKQRRRIISKQIHYFDHPAFGIIVRLERFTPPIFENKEVINKE